MSLSSDVGQYRIGAVSRMTGIALATLRMWERRYQLVDPQRSPAGGRLYSRDDVARLSLIHAVVQAGHAIGTVAKLSDAKLTERVREINGADTVPGQQPIDVMVIGGELPALVRGAEVMDTGVRIVGSAETLGDAFETLVTLEADVLLLEVQAVDSENSEAVIDLIRQIGARLTIVVYGFSGQKFLRRLDAMDVLCMRAPADIPQLLRLCRLGAGVGGDAPQAVAEDVKPDRKFSDLQLRRLMTIDSDVRCECPQQLSGLLTALYAFEQFGQQCGAQDLATADLRGELVEASVKARQYLEEALARLLQVEAIEV